MKIKEKQLTVSHSCMTVKYADSQLRAPRLIVAITPLLTSWSRGCISLIAPTHLFTSPAVTEPTKFLTNADYRRYSDMRIALALRVSSGTWHRAFCTRYTTFRRQTTYQKRPRSIKTKESQPRDVSGCNGGISLNTFVLAGMVNNKTEMHVLRNIQACSCNHCCSGKAISLTHSECVFVALCIQRAMRMCHSHLWPAGYKIFFHIIS
jgi:hypothetical protein